METRVLWVYHSVYTRGGRVENGQTPCLCVEWKRKTYAVGVGQYVELVRCDVDTFSKARKVVHDGALYPVQRSIDVFRGIANVRGATVGALALLDAIERGDDELDDIINSEELVMPKDDTKVENTTSDDTIMETTDKETTMSNTKSKTTTKPAAKKTAPAKPATPAKAKTAAPAKPATPAKASAKDKNALAAYFPAGKEATKPARPVTKKKDGDTPFREGTKKEAAFIAYRDSHEAYEAMSKADKGAWVDKVATKHGVTPGTLRSWIGGQFGKALRTRA